MSTDVIDIETKPKGHQKRPRVTRPDFTHWHKPWEFSIRIATNLDGQEIHDLVDEMTMQYGYTLPHCNWNKIEPFWYVAEIGGYLLGAVQICIGRPIGRIELLAIRPQLSHTKKAKVMKSLVYHAFCAMKLDGIELACMLVADKENEFSRILERWGARFAVKGKMMFFALDGTNGV